MIAITEMIRQLLSFHSIQTICAVPERFDFLNQVALLTIHCLNESAKVPEESESLMGAFDELLVTWVKLGKHGHAIVGMQVYKVGFVCNDSHTPNPYPRL